MLTTIFIDISITKKAEYSMCLQCLCCVKYKELYGAIVNKIIYISGKSLYNQN